MNRRQFVAASTIGLAGCAASSVTQSQSDQCATHPNPATFVLIPGAWCGGWCYAETAKILRSRGHTVFNPSLTGLADRKHLLGPDVNITTHILDAVNLVQAEDLHDIVLVGHSYAGIVIAGASERIPDRISSIVYLDSFVPDEDAESIAIEDVYENPEQLAQLRAQLETGVYGIDPFPSLAEQFGWGPYLHRLTPHPAATVIERVPLSGVWKTIPNKTFVLATESVDARETYERLSNSAGWSTEIYEGNHMIMIDDPEICADILERAIPGWRTSASVSG